MDLRCRPDMTATEKGAGTRRRGAALPERMPWKRTSDHNAETRRYGRRASEVLRAERSGGPWHGLRDSITGRPAWTRRRPALSEN